ncbi:MAG: hypothetical protein RLY93_08525 [Sumerlaeia bacterium]
MIHPLLTDNPHCLRLLRSAQVAFPVTDSPWDDLAEGLGLSRGELEAAYSVLLDEGLIDGLWLEPNPVYPFCLERLAASAAPPPPDGALRWRGASGGRHLASRLWLSEPEEAQGFDGTEVRSVQWFKAGFLPDLTLPEGENLLAAAQDRSMSVEGQPPEDPDFTEDHQAIWKELAAPLALPAGEDPWAAVAARTDLSPDRARRGVMENIVAKRARRLALRPVLARLGWRGTGLACWTLTAEDAPKAAAALARCAGVGDVCLRQSLSTWPSNLCALFLGREAGTGLAAAEAASAKWGRKITAWYDLELT